MAPSSGGKVVIVANLRDEKKTSKNATRSQTTGVKQFIKLIYVFFFSELFVISGLFYNPLRKKRGRNKTINNNKIH